MTMTDQTITADLSILGVTIPARYRVETASVIEEVRALVEQARPILERAQALNAEGTRMGEEVAALAGTLVPQGSDGHVKAGDGAWHLIGVISGHAALFDVLATFADLVAPDPNALA